MPTARSIRILLALTLGLAASSPVFAAPRGKKRDPNRTINRYKKYLSRKPYHAWAFDKLVEAAVSINKLEQLVKDYRRQVTDEPDDRAARIVLVRLLAKTNKVDDALKELKLVPKPDAGLHTLRGELFLRRNEPKQALAALDEAAKATRDKKLLQEIQRRRGEAALMAGRRADAVKAFRAMAALQPKSFNTRLDVAGVFAQHNLVEEALKAFDEADKLAGRDTAKRCRVLAEKGRLYERLIRIKEALQVYHRAIGLMGRGNWLKRELCERVLAIHKRSGRLDELLASCRAQVKASPQDLDAREFLAQALIAADRKPEARDVLQAAVKSFPEDLPLSRRLITLLRDLKDDAAVIAEYQRAIEKHPRELDLYLELGKVFASSGKLEQAKRQWERSLGKRLKDAGLCVRLAQLYAFYDQPEEAIRLYKKAIELEPKEVRHAGDLARYLAARGRKAEVRPLLEAATRAAAKDPSGLQQASQLWQEHGFASDALKALQAALALKANDPRLLVAQADLQVKLDKLDDAAKTLHALINQAKEAPMRRAAVDKLVRLVRKRGSLDGLIKAELEHVAKKSRDVSPYLLLAKAYKLRRRPKRAIAVLETMLTVRPGFEDAHAALARLYTGQGNYPKALANYQALVKASPKSRRKYLKAIARIHLTLYQHEKAFACYEEILRGSPDNPSAFKEVGELYAKLNLIGKARDCLQQAVRLKPEDARFRLELANLHQRMGDSSRAKEELLLAIRSADDEVLQDEARGKLYELMGEEGRIDEEVEALKVRVDKNPYDIEAPLALVDIFIRELEYEQALELLDKLLGYQPKERRLLKQRARIRFLLERYAEAIVDFETLWKLPKSDHEDLGLKIAECAMKAGNLERAKRALEGIKDAQAVADLYEANDLMPEAVAALEQGAKRNPNDARLFQELSKKLNKVERREEAIASLERVIALRGERWKTVVQLGHLYRQAGKTDQALDIGKRLFAIIRLKDKPAKKRKKRKRLARSNSGYSSYWSNYNYYSTYNYYYRGRGFQSQVYRNRVSELRRYFQTLSKEDEFTTLARAELKLQPRNPALLNEVMRHLRRGRDKEGKGIEILREVYAATVPTKRPPAGYTTKTWSEHLDGRLLRRYRQETELCKKRVVELEALVKKGPPQERQWLELIQLLESLRRYDDARAHIEAGIKALPDSYRLQLALGQKLHGEKEPGKAAVHFRRAVALLKRFPPDADDVAKQREDVYKQNRQNLVEGFPTWFRSKVREEHLRRLFKLTRSRWTGSTAWGLGSQPGIEAVKRLLVQVLVKVGGDAAKAEARAVIRSLEPKDPEQLQELSSVNALYFNNEYFADSERCSRALLALERKLERDAILGHNRRWASSFDNSVRNLARVLEKQKKYLEAYELYRTYGNAGAGELVLKSQNLLGDAADRYRKELEACEAAAKRGDRDARKRYRRAGIKWGDVLQIRKKWKEVIAAYERMIKVLPDDFALYEQVALLHERAGRLDDAVGVHQRIIKRKRKLNRVLRRDLTPKGRRLTPLKPPGAGRANEDWIWRSIRGGYYSYGGGGGGNQRYSVRKNYASILKAYLDRRQIGKAAEAMRRLAREDMSTFRWLGWYLGRLIENYRLGAKGVPIMRLLYSYNPGYDHLGIQYGKALVAAKRWKEARRVLSEVVSRSGTRGYYGRQAQGILDRAEAKLSGKKTVTLDDLRAMVKKEPRSMKKRLRLAGRLIDERRFRDAMTHLKLVRKHAPHLREGKTLLRTCYQALGMRKEFIAALRKEFKGSTGQRRFGQLMELVEELYDGQPGEAAALTPEVKKLLAEADEALAKAGARQQRWSIAVWYLMRGYLAEAKAQLEVELKRAGKQKDRADTIRGKLNILSYAKGDPLPAMAFTWKTMKDQTSWSGKMSIVTQLAYSIRRAPDPTAWRETVMGAAEKLGGLQGDLYRLAYHLAIHDRDASLAAIEVALKREGKQGYYLHTMKMRLLNPNNDKALELKMLEEREALRKAGKLIALGASEESARKSYVQARARLLFDLDRKAEALELWKKEYDVTILENKRRMVSKYEQHGEIETAVKLLKEYIAKKGDKNYRLLEQLARLRERQERWDDAIELYRRVMILQPSRLSSCHENLQRCYKASDRLAVYRKELEDKVKADPDDMDTLGILIQLAFAMKDDARAIEGLKVRATRHNLAPLAWEQLADHYWAEGDRAQAVKYMEKRLAGNVDSWQLRRLTERLAEHYLKAKDLKKTKEMLKKGYQDPDSPKALQGMASFLIRKKRVDLALPMLTEAVALKPRDGGSRRQLATALRQAGKPKEALEHLFVYALLPSSIGTTTAIRFELVHLADASGADANLAKALAAATGKTPKAIEERVKLLLQSGLLALARRRLDEARKHFEAAKALDPDNLHAPWGLMRAAWLKPDLAEAERRIEELYAWTEREPNKLYSLRRRVFKLRTEVRLRRGDVEGARKQWRKIERMRGSSSYRYAYYRDPFQGISNEINSLGRHHLYPAWRETMERGHLLQGSSYRGKYNDALFRTGDHARAIKRAWQGVVDPVSRVLGNSYSSSSRRRYWSSRRRRYYSSSSGRSAGMQLLRYYRELGRLPELRKRLEELEAARPKDTRIRGLVDQLLRESKQHEALLARYRKRRAKSLADAAKAEKERLARKLPPRKPRPNTAYQSQIVGQLIELERWEEALKVQLELLAATRELAKKGRPSNSYSFNRYNRSYYGSSSYRYNRYRYSSGGSYNLASARQRAMALLAKVGRTDEAKALEQEALKEATKQARRTGGIHQALARSYSYVKLGDEVVRLMKIARERAELDTAKIRVLQEEATILKRLEHPGRTAAVEGYLSLLAKQHAERPFALQNTRSLVWFLVEQRFQLERAEAEARKLVAASPRNRDYRKLLGRALLLQGRHAEALKAFQAARRLVHETGGDYLPDLLFGLGLAQAKLDPAKAAPILRRALAMLPLGTDADAARKVLQ